VAQQTPCPLIESVYRAIAKPELELVFGSSKSGIATEIATFMLEHKTHGDKVRIRYVNNR
jgi:hypothetical protein